MKRQTDPAQCGQMPAVELSEIKQRLLTTFNDRYQKEFTANEAAEVTVQRFAGANVETYRKRVGELHSAGLIKATQVRKCRVTGKQAQAFRLPRSGQLELF